MKNSLLLAMALSCVCANSLFTMDKPSDFERDVAKVRLSVITPEDRVVIDELKNNFMQEVAVAGLTNDRVYEELMDGLNANITLPPTLERQREIEAALEIIAELFAGR